ncbi:DUF300-domain-containing protein [Macrolepiota fuliginosa MF-IS2]|uniref:DUF300-domain-containing protein n=1 Tax=Macrolepiota fuliginosa MF-IS2 TaxID=1400762 RepID=A0A9P5XNG0_9AGAR|nr:DUF300-domain-containing protein [Macrolepiota fuliginosa MF-IS2]
MSSSPDPEVCHKEKAESPPSLFQNGNLVGWIVAGCFTIIATVTSFWLVNKHLQWYTNKREQRYIVRLLFMVPLYAIISLASYLWWSHATPLILIRDGYESTVLTAFFYLLLMYLSPVADEQRQIFMKHGLSRQNDIERMKKGEPVQRWVFPLGFIKWKPIDGLYFLQLMKWGVLQYCVLRPLTTLIAVVLDYMGLYCESSWGLGWGHIYLVIVVSLSVTIAMYCLIQLYVAVSRDLAKHKPLLKLFAIKAVVFLTFWQATFLSVLSMFGVVKDTKYMTADDINIGIGALLETFEMMLFAFLHVSAFTYKPYRPFHDPKSGLPPPKRTARLKSLGHAMDFRETLRELWAGCVYIWHRFRGKEPVSDVGAVRAAHYEGIFGKQRPSQLQHDHDDGGTDLKQPTLPNIRVEIDENTEVDIGGEKQWLGTGDDYGYGLKFLRRERSEGLEEQIEKELGKRGYTLRGEPVNQQHPQQKSWWRSIYNRISQTGHDEVHQIEDSKATFDMSAPRSWARSRSRTGRQSHSRHFSRDSDAERRLLANAMDIDLEDQPPPSLIVRKNRHELRQSVDQWRQSIDPQYGTEDVLMPLPVPLPDYVAYRSGHAPRTREKRVPVSGPSTPSAAATHRLEGMFKDAVGDPPVEYTPSDIVQSEVSSVEGYRLAKKTPPVCFVPSQPAIMPTNQSRMAAQRRSILYHLTDGINHVPMIADIIDAGVHDQPVQSGSATVTSPVPSHRREFANHGSRSPDLDAFPLPPDGPTTAVHQQRQSRAGPSTLPTSCLTMGLRRSSAQYYTSGAPSRKRHSLSLNTDVAYSSPSSPISPRRKKPYDILPPPGPYRQDEPTQSRATRNLSQQIPANLAPAPQNHASLLVAQSPTSPTTNDGLSRYPPHFSSPYPTIPRQT